MYAGRIVLRSLKRKCRGTSADSQIIAQSHRLSSLFVENFRFFAISGNGNRAKHPLTPKRDGSAVSFGRQGVFCTISITGNGKKTEIFHKKAGQTM